MNRLEQHTPRVPAIAEVVAELLYDDWNVTKAVNRLQDTVDRRAAEGKPSHRAESLIVTLNAMTVRQFRFLRERARKRSIEGSSFHSYDRLIDTFGVASWDALRKEVDPPCQK